MIDILIMDDSGIKVEALRHVITNLLPNGVGEDRYSPQYLQGQAADAGNAIRPAYSRHGDATSWRRRAIAYGWSGVFGWNLSEREHQGASSGDRFDRIWRRVHPTAAGFPWQAVASSLYSHKDTNWRKDLQQKLLQLHQFKKSLAECLENRSKYDVAIICTHAEELEQILSTFSLCQWDYMENDALPYIFRTATIHTAGLHELRIIATCTDKPGVCATSVLATALYTVFKVDVFMVGSVSGQEAENHAEEHIVVAESIKGKK